MLAEPAEPVTLPSKAAWLHGNLRDNPGVLGLGHCARLERFGDNLRWMLDANHPSSALTNAGSAGAQPALSAQQMLATAGKLDLVNNVFQNGVHGSLRNTIVEVGSLPDTCSACSEPAHGMSVMHTAELHLSGIHGDTMSVTSILPWLVQAQCASSCNHKLHSSADADHDLETVHIRCS